MVRIDCAGIPMHNHLIEGTGILTIQEDCKFKTEKVLNQAFKVFRHDIFPEAQPFGRVNLNVSAVMNKLTSSSIYT